jgi:hypothetical protein
VSGSAAFIVSFPLGLCLALGACAEKPRAWDASVEEVLEREIALAPDHPWAGVYESYPMANCWEKLVLSPSGAFTYHGSCCLVTYERQGGDVRFDRHWVVLRPDAPVEGRGFQPEPSYRLVPWGDLRFLIDPEAS